MITSLPIGLLHSASGAFRTLELCNPGTRGIYELRVGVGMTSESPPAFHRLGEQHPGPPRKRGIARGSSDQIGELADYGELLVTIERPRIRKHLHPDVVAVSLDIRECSVGEIVNESR